jgi:hypothetical protein
VTRVDRREFSSLLADQGGRIQVDSIPSRLIDELEGLGVSRDTLSQIAGSDHVISGAEFNELYDALALRTDGRGGRVDARVSEVLFRSLAARVERTAESHADLSSGSSRGAP